MSQRLTVYVLKGSMMKAIVQDKYGSAEVLTVREIDRPTIGDGEVLVRVHAASLHIGDWHLMTGLPYLVRLGVGLGAPKTRVRGMDLAGTVAAVGKNVTRFAVGDAVYGTGAGALAEYARAREKTLAPKPVNLTFEQAAAVPTSACTALHSLRDVGGLQPGQTVLIIGASGGVGLFAVQLAKAMGGEVTGVCSRAKMELVRAIGADHGIDYMETDVTRSGQRYDLILDMGGHHPLSDLRRALTPDGTVAIVGSDEDDHWTGGLGRMLQALVISPFVRQTLRPVVSIENAADLLHLKALIESGTITPIIDEVYGLEDAAAAMQRLTTGQARGKLVIAMAPSLPQPLVGAVAHSAS